MLRELKISILLVLSLATSPLFAQNGFRTGQYDGQANVQYDGRANRRDGVGQSDLASGVARGRLGTPGTVGTPTDTTTLTSTTMRRRLLIREIAGGLIDPMIGLPGLFWATAIYEVAANSSAQDDYAHRPSANQLGSAICFDTPVDNTAFDYRNCSDMDR